MHFCVELVETLWSNITVTENLKIVSPLLYTTAKQCWMEVIRRTSKGHAYPCQWMQSVKQPTNTWVDAGCKAVWPSNIWPLRRLPRIPTGYRLVPGQPQRLSEDKFFQKQTVSSSKFLETYSLPGNITWSYTWGTWNSLSFRFGVQAGRGMAWLVWYNWVLCWYLKNRSEKIRKSLHFIFLKVYHFTTHF